MTDIDWKTIFEDRGHDAEPVEGPVRDEEAGEPALEWFQVLTRFTQRGFMRAIVADAGEKVKAELQVALPGGDDSGYLDALTRYLQERGLDVEVVSEERPWTLDLLIDSDQELATLVDDFERLSGHVRRAEQSESIAALAAEWSSEDGAESDTSPAESDSVEDASDSPFESIGDDEPDEEAEPPTDDEVGDEAKTGDSSRRARLDAFSLRVADGAIVLTAEADIDSDEAQLDTLARSLRSKLENRFDLVTRATDVAAADDELSLTMEPSELGATYGMPLGELCDDVARYLDRQRELADLGMSLDSVAPVRSPKSSRESRSPSAERTSHGERTSRTRTEPEDDEDSTGVVFGFGEEEIAAASPSESTLEAGDYTDPRVMREDATTALVDVVLRHPGYSDRNMRQVLSILLDIDYYRAGKLIDDAPCVVAWGVSQERAREFKRVIERAGGRVTLVEPDTLAEAE